MIWIIGPGALGSALAQQASTAGAKVRLFGRADSIPASIEADQIWVTCKRTQLGQVILDWRARLNPSQTARLYFAQNGLGLTDQLQACGLQKKWTRVACWWGARFTAAGLELTAPPRRMSLCSDADATFWRSCGFEVEVESTQGSNRLEWRKALTNLTLNPITTLHRVPNGALLQNSDWIAQARLLHLEARSVAEALGIGLSPEALTWNEVLKTAQNTANNRNSLLQDLEAGRDWELPWLNEGLVGRAQTLGISVPQNEAIVASLQAMRANLK